MNAHQRRSAYRALPKRGTVMEIERKGCLVKVRVLGYSAPVDMLASTAEMYAYKGKHASVRRVYVERIPGPFETAARSTPLVSRLIAI